MLSSQRSARLPRVLFGAAAVAAATFIAASAEAAPDRIRVLIVDGQNNHQWATTTPLLKKMLEDTGRFAVDVSTSPPAPPAAPRLAAKATDAEKAAHPEKLRQHAAALKEHEAQAPALWAKWRPRFSDYAAVISNYTGEAWPAEVRTAFEAYVRNGGGFVVYHAADNAFPEWPEYNEMIGLGGWGGRDEKSGPYLRLRDGKWVEDMTPGRGGAHGPQHEFLIDVREAQHPILAGLPARWKHTLDELYDSLRGPARNLTVLASAWSSRTNEHEPILMALRYGQGRVFHTALGHYIEALNGIGFQVTFQRGVEWAATGRVTLPAPGPGVLSEARAAAATR